MRTIVCSALMALVITASEAAEVDKSETANTWLPYCKSYVEQELGPPAKILSMGVCAGIVMGISFAEECKAPDGVTFGQEVRIVVRYIEARPKRMHESFYQLAYEALREAWPCRP